VVEPLPVDHITVIIEHCQFRELLVHIQSDV